MERGVRGGLRGGSGGGQGGSEGVKGGSGGGEGVCDEGLASDTSSIAASVLERRAPPAIAFWSAPAIRGAASPTSPDCSRMA